jgi:hypothetical protein
MLVLMLVASSCIFNIEGRVEIIHFFVLMTINVDETKKYDCDMNLFIFILA